MAGSELRIRDNIFLASVKLHVHLARDLLYLFFAYINLPPFLRIHQMLPSFHHDVLRQYDGKLTGL